MLAAKGYLDLLYVIIDADDLQISKKAIQPVLLRSVQTGEREQFHFGNHRDEILAEG